MRPVSPPPSKRITLRRSLCYNNGMTTDTPLLIARYGNGFDDVAIPFPKFYLREDVAFFNFCNDNADSTLSFEREPDGEVILMPPSSTDTGRANATVLFQIALWNAANGEPGYVFDASTGFQFPNGAIRAPDASFITKVRYDALTEKEREMHAPIAPDFVVEVMSPSDRLKKSQKKMTEYLANGVRLGWLVNRQTRTVYVFRQSTPMETLVNPLTVSGGAELPGFVLPLRDVFPAITPNDANTR